MPLAPGQIGVLAQASRLGVCKSIQRIQKYWTRKRWLAARNKYRKDVVGQINRDSPDRTTWTPVHGQLSDYISASTVLHCFDGWSYLSRALEAELAGDPDAARHLGYYAELRAAMALLACDGIGVFKSKHVIVDKEGKCVCLRSEPTHVFTWEALQWWAGTPGGVTTLQSAINPGGVSLREWLSHYPSSLTFIATHWLQQWGLDLSRLANDRESRNLASYRPTTFTSAGATSVEETLSAINEFWDMCDPGGSGGFPILDRHLLRLGIDQAFTSMHDRTRRQLPRQYRSDISAMLHGVSPSEMSMDSWKSFLSYESYPETPKIFLDAAADCGPDHAAHSKQVIARAVLLLRVATGSAENLLREATANGYDDLRFWWSSNLVRRHLWAEGDPPHEFTDLWVDIREALDGISHWLQSTPSPCGHTLWREQSAAAATLTTAERVVLWGLRL